MKTRFRLTSARSGAHLLCCIALISAITATALTGQTWQAAYGHYNSVQEGYRGVIPVTDGCYDINGAPAENGYIAVGHTSNATVTQVYVVRTLNDGSPVWEYRYDIGDNGGRDFGQDIVELASGDGFVITGYTDDGSSADAFLMKINCLGEPQWVQTYDEGDDEYAYDVIEANTGNAGDLIICGKIDDGNTDGFILRAESDGDLLWARRYSEGSGDDDVFWSLAELETYDTQTTGDIIAVGSTTDITGLKQGYAVRVEGTDGTFSTSPLQGTALFGSTGEEEFFSVIQLNNPNETGTLGQPNVVMAGYTTSFTQYTNNQDVYLVKLEDGDPCEPLIQTIAGHVSQDMPNVAHCIREIQFDPQSDNALFEQWDLVYTGYYEELTAVDKQMIIVCIDPTTLWQASPGFSNSFGLVGGNSGYEEIGWSISPVEETGDRTEGFILCGLTTSAWHIESYSDPGDMYLVKTDYQGLSTSDCELSYSPYFEDVEWSVDCGSLTPPTVMADSMRSWDSAQVSWYDSLCTYPYNDGKRVVLTRDLGYDGMTPQPNPVASGGNVILLLNSVDPNSTVNITVVNALGEELEARIPQFSPSTGEIVLSTQSWPAGVYHIRVENGASAWSTRIVVTE